MSVAYQADIFCDGEHLLGQNVKGCSWFIEHGEVSHDSVKGLAAGAWEVAKANGWTRVRREYTGLGSSMLHLCPKCSDAIQTQEQQP